MYAKVLRFKSIWMLQTMKYVVVRMMGGFGNQLFQYALYDYLINEKIDALIDISHYSMSNSQFHETISLLSSDKIRFTNLGVNYIYNHILMNRFLKHSYSAMSNRYFIERVSSLYLNISTIKRLIKFEKPLIVEGYFQGTITISKSLKKQLLYAGKSSLKDNENQFLLNNILSHKNSVSIHVRRGDYLHGNELRVLDIEYYETSIKRLLDLVDNDPFYYVFSDDIDWCKEHFKGKRTIHFVEINKGIHSYKDMFLMASCKHNIISASTFSWWAAYLNNNPDKIVVAPKFWYTSKYRYKENFDLKVPGWIYV
jgi:hypothetical protein